MGVAKNCSVKAPREVPKHPREEISVGVATNLNLKVSCGGLKTHSVAVVDVVGPTESLANQFATTAGIIGSGLTTGLFNSFVPTDYDILVATNFCAETILGDCNMMSQNHGTLTRTIGTRI